MAATLPITVVTTGFTLASNFVKRIRPVTYKGIKITRRSPLRVRSIRCRFSKVKAWLDAESENKRILPKSPIRAAFTYTLNQWDALCRFTEAGFLSYDNNLAERMVKSLPSEGRTIYLLPVPTEVAVRRFTIHSSAVPRPTALSLTLG